MQTGVVLVAPGGSWPVRESRGKGSLVLLKHNQAAWFVPVPSGASPAAPSLPHPHPIGCFILEASVASTHFLFTCEYSTLFLALNT